MFPASLNPDRLIGSVNPGYGGGLVGRLYPADSGKEEQDVSCFGWGGCFKRFLFCM